MFWERQFCKIAACSFQTKVAGGHAMNVLIERDPDTSNRFLPRCNSKKRGWILPSGYFQERRRAGPCVGVRKRIPHVEPDLPVVSVFHQGIRVMAVPRANPSK